MTVACFCYAANCASHNLSVLNTAYIFNEIVASGGLTFIVLVYLCLVVCT